MSAAKPELVNFERNSILSELVKSPHGSLKDYVPKGLLAAEHDPEFFAHLITWNAIHGEIKNSKNALPVIALRKMTHDDKEFAENAIANLVALDPRNLMIAYNFNKDLSKMGRTITAGNRRLLEKAMKTYIQVREKNPNWWNKTAMQHRDSLKSLYAVSHYKPATFAQMILFDKKYPAGSPFEQISKLKDMTPKEAASVILKYRIPYQIALGSLGKKKEEYINNPDYALVFLENMSGQQLLNSTKFLTSLGVFSNKMLTAAYNKALEKSSTDKKVSTLKASKVLDAVKGLDEDVAKKLSNFQEAKISSKSLEGDWVILGDMSGSMAASIEMSVQISSYLAKSVSGKVYLLFFNDAPTMKDVTGKTYEEIKDLTKYIASGGGTAIGCGMKYLEDRNIVVNGITIVSDGEDLRNPLFSTAYPSYVKKMGIEPTVYFYKIRGGSDRLTDYCNHAGINMETFDLTKGVVDYYSLPNFINTMSTMRYGIIDKIMETPLLTLEQVFKQKED